MIVRFHHAGLSGWMHELDITTTAAPDMDVLKCQGGRWVLKIYLSAQMKAKSFHLRRLKCPVTNEELPFGTLVPCLFIYFLGGTSFNHELVAQCQKWEKLSTQEPGTQRCFLAAQTCALPCEATGMPGKPLRTATELSVGHTRAFQRATPRLSDYGVVLCSISGTYFKFCTICLRVTPTVNFSLLEYF